MIVVTLDSPTSRAKAKRAIDAAVDGLEMRIVAPDKSRDQEEKYHAMLGDIAKQCQHLNMRLDLDTWKRLCIDQFKRDTLKEPVCCAQYWARHQLSVMPSLDGSAVIMLGEQSRRFPKGVATVFIEWLHAFGGEREVVWSDPTVVPVEAYVA